MKSPSRFGAAALTSPGSLPQQMLHQDLEAHQDQHEAAKEFCAALVPAAEDAADFDADHAALDQLLQMLHHAKQIMEQLPDRSCEA